MEPDKYQQAWQTQASQARVTVAADLLRNEVERNQQDFRLTILLRDIREVGVGLVMIPVWFFLGGMMYLPWSWYLTVPALIWVVGFILVDRMRQPRRPCEPSGPLVESVQASLAEVEHQIWLLRNVFWWYLLPFTVSILAFFFQTAWSTGNWLELLGPALVVVVIFKAIYYLNQFAVRRRLQPRRQELLALLTSLKDEANDSAEGVVEGIEAEGGEAGAINTPATVKTSAARGRTLSLMALLVALTTLTSIAAYYAGLAMAGYPKVSPFAAVRWQESQPEVKLGDEWFKLVALDDLPAAEIVAFSQRTYGDKWQKRFEEDLVELLSTMGHRPQDAVKLVVQSLTSPETRTLEDVPMTSANRRAIRNAAQARERDEK